MANLSPTPNAPENVFVVRKKDFSIVAWDKVTRDVNSNPSTPTSYNIFKTQQTNATDYNLVGTVNTSQGQGQLWTNLVTNDPLHDLQFRSLYLSSPNRLTGEDLEDQVCEFNGVSSFNITPGGAVTINKLFFLTENIGFAVGAGGMIIVTSDSGMTWTAQTSGTAQTLTSICFINALVGWTCGANGTILSTVNGGTTWTVQTSGTANYLRDIIFVDASHGWCCGNNATALYTSNGGTTWTAQAVPITGLNFNRLTFSDINNGYIVGAAGTILNTSNGGTLWVQQVSGTGSSLNSVQMLGSLAWVAGDQGTVLKTVSGGLLWFSQTSPTFTTVQSHLLSFVDPLNAWIATDGGNIYNTIDGGQTWQVQTSPVVGTPFYDVKFVTGLVGYAAGAGAAFLYTVDGGVTWQVRSSQLFEPSTLPLVDPAAAYQAFTPQKTTFSGVILTLSSAAASFTTNLTITLSKGATPTVSTPVVTQTFSTVVPTILTATPFYFSNPIAITPGQPYLLTISRAGGGSTLLLKIVQKQYNGTVNTLFIDVNDIIGNTPWYYKVRAVNVANEQSVLSDEVTGVHFVDIQDPLPEAISLSAVTHGFWDQSSYDSGVVFF